MKHFVQEARRVSLRRNPLAFVINGVLVGVALAPSHAFAQSAASSAEATQAQIAQQLDTVTVSGSYSRSLEKAVDIKRGTVGFSDSIVATDVADFPEQNLSEALQRMPGVTIERNKGLGTKVNVRGLPSEYTHVSINNLATASGSGGRDVEFDIFASEIIQQVTVQKSPTAADEEGGIAGSVKISTARPFDYNGRKLVVSAEGAYNDISEKTDPKLSFLASNTWGDWGALVSFSKEQRTNRTDSTSGINFRGMDRFINPNTGARGDQALDVLERDAGIVLPGRTDKIANNNIIFQDKVGDRVYLSDQDKWGATASLQYRPSSDFSLTFDAMRGGYDTTEDEYDIAAYSASSRSTLERIYDYDATTLAKYGMVVLRDVAYTATQHEALSKEHLKDTDYSQYSVTMNWKPDTWQIDALVGYSGAKKTSDDSNLKHVAYAPSRTRWTDKSGETIPSDNPNTIDMYASPDKYLFEAYETTLEKVSDDKYAAQLDFKNALEVAFLPALSDVQFGVRYTDKSKERDYGAYNIKGSSAGASDYVGRPMTSWEIQPITDIVPGGDYRPKDIEWQQVSNDYARRTFRYDGFVTPFDPGAYYRVDEKVTSLYAMADFNFDVGKVPVSINAGARYVDTSVDSFGYHPLRTDANNNIVYADAPSSQKGSYKDFLPSFNLTAELADDLLLRAAASKTLMRPALDKVAYKRTASWNSFYFEDGNPSLEPTYAKQWEIGLEKYLSNGGLLAASYFRKRIEGVVERQKTGVEHNVTKYNANGTVDGVYDFDVYQPVNVDGAYDVSGVELNANLPLGAFVAALEGFGISANYTWLDSSLSSTTALGISTAPTGLADKTYNFTAYYENDRFDARVSYNYKGDYIEGIVDAGYPVTRDDYGQVDVSIGYKLTDNVKLSLKAINLTDEATTGYTLDPSFPTMYEFSGRRISLGIRADF